MNATIQWRQDAIDELIQAAGALLDDYGQRIIDAAAPPVDTGFLKASAYLHSERQSTFDATWNSGLYAGKRGGMEQRHRAGGPESPPEHGAIVGWAAAHAYFVDERQPFIYNALLSVVE